MRTAMHHTIDFDFILDIGMRGIRRASTFLGLGVNAAQDKEFKKYQLNEFTLFRVMPDEIDDDRIEEFKAHFQEWIVRCALREVTESLCVYLETLNKACLRMSVSKGEMAADAAQKNERAFDHAGLTDKLTLLCETFGVGSVREKYFSGINQARNCITHRRGIVGHKDLNSDGLFHLSWWKMEMFVETESGKVIPFGSPPRQEPIIMEEPGTVCARIVDAEKLYKHGEPLILSPTELAEMIFLTDLTIKELFRNAIKYAQELGIVFKGTEPPEEEIEFKSE